MQKETGCCPIFDPAPWQDKEVTWKDKLFIRDTVASFMHIPLNMGKIITRMSRRVQEVGAEMPPQDFMILSDEVSSWKSIQYMAVSKEVPNAENIKMSGTFLTKVFEGPFQDAPKWYAQMSEFVKSRGKTPTKIYTYYTTCPKCAKAYGKNYVVLLARI